MAEVSTRRTMRVRDRSTLLGGLVIGLGALVLVHVLLRGTYWDYSEGVYAMSAHLMLHGRALYSQMAGAQPPGVFLAGLGLLAVHDSLEWLRFGVACLQLAAGLIAGRMVLEITGSRVAAVLTPAGVLLTPWAVHEHGALTPELVALPLLLGAASLVADERRAVAAGVLCGLLPLVKLPFAIPALVLLAVAADRRRTAVTAALTALTAFGLTTAVAGGSFWQDTVVAQTQTGARVLSRLDGFWAQAAWNVLGLLVAAGLAVLERRQARNPRLFAVLCALAVAMIITFLTNFKEGTGLNIAVPVEATLVPLAACGTVFALRRPGSRWPALVCGAALVFTLAQTISLIAAPRHSIPFLRAGSQPAWAILMTRPQFQAAVVQAQRCPRRVAYSGSPLIAFVAGRSMPAGQADQFIITHSHTLSALRRQVAAVSPLCP